jgi:hypothetical protein
MITMASRKHTSQKSGVGIAFSGFAFSLIGIGKKRMTG